jgi:hypothetical protein
MAKRPRTRLETPVGKSQWVQLNKPDDFGNYTVSIKLSDEDTNNLISHLTNLNDDAFADFSAKSPKKLTKKVLSVVKEKETGTEFTFKVKAGGVTKEGKEWTKTVPVFDANGKVVANPPIIGRDSDIIVFFSALESSHPSFGTGVKIELDGVQVVNLAEWGGDSRAKPRGGNYAAGGSEGHKESPAVSSSKPSDDLDDEIPF